MRTLRLFALLFITVLVLSSSIGCQSFGYGTPYLPGTTIQGGGCTAGGGGYFGAPT